MLDRLPVDLLEYLLRFAPRSAPTLRRVCRIPWTPSLVRLLAEARLANLYHVRRRRTTCICAGCGAPSVDALFFYPKRTFSATSPYCRDHLPEGTLRAAAIRAEGAMTLWW